MCNRSCHDRWWIKKPYEPPQRYNCHTNNEPCCVVWRGDGKGKWRHCMKSMTKGYMPCERHVVLVIWYDVSRCLITDEEIIPRSAVKVNVSVCKGTGSSPDLGWHQISKKADSTHISINSVELGFLSLKILTVFHLKNLVIVDEFCAFPNLSNYPPHFRRYGGARLHPSPLTLRDVLLLTSLRWGSKDEVSAFKRLEVRWALEIFVLFGVSRRACIDVTFEKSSLSRRGGTIRGRRNPHHFGIWKWRNLSATCLCNRITYFLAFEIGIFGWTKLI